MRNVLLGAALLAGATLAQAHAHLRSSIPADASTLSAAPPGLELTFSEAALVTAASIQEVGGTPRKLLPLPTQAAAQVRLALPALLPGAYVVSWRVLSADGHITPGKIHFTIAPPGAQKHSAAQ
jgi:methionine-rich copper-binding protein CopC